MITIKEPNLDLLGEEKKQLVKDEQEMREIKKWLASHDYIVNKRLLGEYTATDPKWLAYQTERAEKLRRYNELEAALK